MNTLPSLQAQNLYVTPKDFEAEKRQMRYIQKLVNDKRRVNAFKDETKEDMEYELQKTHER